MTIAPILRASATPSTASDLTLSYSGSIGQYFVVCGGSSLLPSATTGVTDNGSNTWTLIESCPPSGTTGRRCFMYVCLATANFTSITVSHDHLGQMTASLVEITGFDVLTPLDTHASASHSGSATPAAVTATPTNPGSLEICLIQANTNLATTGVNVPSGYTDLPGYNTAGPKIVYKVGATAGTPDGAAFTLSVSQGSGAVTAFFNAQVVVAMSDSMTQTETSMGLEVDFSLTESMTQTETSMGIEVDLSLTDSSTFTDTVSIAIPIAMSDSMTQTEGSMVISQAVPMSDTSTFTDSLGVGVTNSLSDTSTFTESMSIIIPVVTVVPPYQSQIVGNPVIAQLYAPAVPSLGIPSLNVQKAITSGVIQIKRRVEIYESDAVTPFNIVNWNGRLSAGSISVDGTRAERRIMDITLDNSDFALNLNPYNGMYYDKIIKVFWGIVYHNTTTSGVLNATPSYWEIQLGEFMIDTFDEDRFPHELHITGRDYTKLCMNTDINQSETFDSTYPVEEIITGLAANAGVKKFRMPATGLYFTDGTTFDIGSARWDIMQKIADSVGYEVYFTADGYLTMRPYQDPVSAPLVYTFNTGATSGTLVTYKKSSNDSLIKNHTLVIGATVTDDSGISTTAYGESVNDDPSSPTRRYRADGSIHLGDRMDVFRSDYITTTADAQALSDQRLRVMGLEEYAVDFSSMIIPWLDANDIVQVVSATESVYTPLRFLLSSFSIPLGLGAMSGNAKRVTVIGSPSTIGVVS